MNNFIRRGRTQGNAWEFSRHGYGDAEKASVLMAVSPAEATLLLLGLDKSERTKVVTKLPAHVQDSIASADSLIKVPCRVLF